MILTLVIKDCNIDSHSLNNMGKYLYLKYLYVIVFRKKNRIWSYALDIN